MKINELAKKKAVPSKQRDPGALATRAHISSQEKKHADWAEKQRELEKQFYANHPELADKKDVAEGSGNIGAGIKSLFQKIYDQGDDEIEYFYYESPVFAQYWDRYEGDIDSVIAEVDPAELQIIHDELEAYVEGAGLAEGWKEKLAGAALAGTMAFGGAGRAMASDAPINPDQGRPAVTQVQKQNVDMQKVYQLDQRMQETNPKYAQERAQLPSLIRGISPASQAHNTKVWNMVADLLVKYGQRVNEGEVVPFKRAAPSWQKLPRDVLTLANDWFWADYESGGLQATMDPKGLGSGIANQQKYLGAQLQQRGWAIDFDDEFENVVLKNRQGQTVLLPIEDAQDFTGWAQGTNPVSEQQNDSWGPQGNFAGDKHIDVGGVSIKPIQVGDVVKYLGQKSEVVGISKNRKYARITIVSGMGGTTKDVPTSDLQQLGQGMSEGLQQLTVQQLATISDEALDKAYGYGRSTPGNTFGWQANLMSAAYAKKMIDAGVTDIEKISDAIHKGWNVTAQKFVQNPNQFDDTEKLRQAGKLEAKLQQRAKLMKINYAQLDNEEQEKDRVVARALLQAIKGQQGVVEGSDKLKGTPVVSLSDFSDKDDKKDRYGRTVPKKLKKDDPRVRFHKEPKKPGVAEMDSQGYKGTRDQGDPYAKGSKATPVKAKDVVKQGVKALNKAHPDYGKHEKKLIGKMSNAEKVDKGWRNPNIDEQGVAEGSLEERTGVYRNQTTPSKLLSAQDRQGVISVKIQAHDGTQRSFADSNPLTVQKWLGRYGLTLPRNINDKFVYEQDVTEADDPKFVGFMNKAMANKVDAPKADSLAKAPDWYKNAPAMNFDSMPSHKKALQFGLKVLSKLDPETKQQLAAGGEQAIVDYLVDVSERTLGARGTIDFVEEDIWECQDYLSNVFHDPNITSWVDVLKTGLNEVSDATLTSYLTKVDADARKHRADPTKRSAAKRDKSVAGFSRALNKLDARKAQEFAPRVGEANLESVVNAQRGGMPLQDVNEARESCPECGGPMFPALILGEKQDACYYKVKSRYKVWPSAYASGALVQCRKKGAANWGNKGK